MSVEIVQVKTTKAKQGPKGCFKAGLSTVGTCGRQFCCAFSIKSSIFSSEIVAYQELLTMLK